MAEAVFRASLLPQHEPHIGAIDSAGTGAYHTLEPPDPRTMATLHSHGIADYDHGARKVRPADFDDFDYILAMDSSNLRDLQRTQWRVDAKRRSGDGAGARGTTGDKTKAKVMLFGEFGGRGKEEVADPYYGGDGGFEEVFEQVSRLSKGFLKGFVEKSAKE